MDASADSIRLFVALLPSAPGQRALAALMEGVPGVRWMSPDQLHLTLRFIGEVAPETRVRTEDVLAEIRVRPFFLDLESVGVFPPRGPPAALWAGIGSGHPLLHQLRQQVDDRLLAAGVPLRLRPFVPHFTLGRTRKSPPVAVAHWLKRHREFVGPMIPVRAFHLMASQPNASGPVYRSLRRFPLQRD